MKVYLEKAGFVRDEVNDFADDGTRFYCYKIPGCRVRISKATGYGNIYLAGRLDGNLEYEEYSQLPHYKDMDKLNGISQDAITKQDIEDFYRACLLYNKEYTEAENNIQYPEVEEILERYNVELKLRKAELAKIEAICTVDKLLNMSDLHLKWFKNAYNSLKLSGKTNCTPEEWAIKQYGTRYSRSYVKSIPTESYYYRECMEYLK